MYVVCVTIHVKPEFVDQFIAATLDNARNTRMLEPGNVRWDFLQAEEDPNRFFLYEAYKAKEDFPKHQQMDHYLRWRALVQDWMAEPRIGIRHHSIVPADDDWNL